MIVRQVDFTGGMSALVDSTKTASDAYRLGINTRIRKNGIEAGFRHVKWDTPAGLHQAVFANDNALMLYIAGNLQRVDLTSRIVIPIGSPLVISLSATADRIYHAAVPAPTSYVVKDTYQPEVSQFTAAIVVQDGVNQPVLIFPDFGYRTAHTFVEWSYEDPEYIPIGTFMAYSGRKLFIANGNKIYQSVSGRPTDFVMNIDNDGNKQGDADTTHLAVANPSLTLIHPAQGGGLLASTRYGMYGLTPEYQLDLIFGEPQYVPSDVFPVGAVNDLSFAFVNGESLFVSPAGIQSFNQVMQVQRASNNTPYGAKIVEYLIRPISSTATAVVDDYTFIAVETIFGPAVLVHDNVIGAFAGFDLVSATVKEFATVEDNGLTRLFYITGEGLYEIPLYSGTRNVASVYIGEISSAEANKLTRVMNVDIGLNNVRSSGQVEVAVYTDKRLDAAMRKAKTLTLTAEEEESLITEAPQRLPLGPDVQTSPISFDFTDSKKGYANGVMATLGLDARLVTVAININEFDQPSATPQLVDDAMEIYNFLGNITADESSTSDTTRTVTAGVKYVAYASATTETVKNGNETFIVPVGYAKVFVAKTEYLFTTATVEIYAYTTFISSAVPATKTILLPRLGGLVTPTPLAGVVSNLNLDPRAVLGADELTDEPTARAFYSAFKSYSQMRIETTYANLFCFSDVTADLVVGGTAMAWLQGQITAFGLNKFNIVCFPRAPYTSSGTAATDLRWPMEDLGVHAVISPTDVSDAYERSFVDGAYYIVTAGCKKLIFNTLSNVIQASYNGDRDQFTILR